MVSRSEDLDDNRPGEILASHIHSYSIYCTYCIYHTVPFLLICNLTMNACFAAVTAEEQSLPTKMLMKLKGTFKIRLFQGNDWRTSPQQQAGGYKAKDAADVDTMKKATGSGDKNMQQHSVSSTTAAVTDKGDGTGGSGGGKSVRFCKEDLLRDLTTPPPATTAAAAATAKPSSSTHRPATSSSDRSSGGSRGSSKPSSHPTTATSRPPRSQRPLFEVLDSFVTQSEPHHCIS